MKYDFDEPIPRYGSGSMKYDEAPASADYGRAIPMWVADMDFCTPPCVISALKKRAEHGIFGYSSRDPELYAATAQWQRQRHGADFDPALMSYSPGVVPGMRLLIQLFSSAGDGIIVQQPVYFPFTDIVQNSGRRLLVNPLRRTAQGGYEMNLEDFEAKAKQGARLFLLCNPHNPVGRVWSRSELKAVGDICLRYGVDIISDEIHGDIMLGGALHTPMACVSPEIAAVTMTCTSPSKTFNLAGLQTSVIIFNNEERRMAYFQEMRKMDLARCNSFGIAAATAAYRGGAEWLDELLIYLEGNMRYIFDFCAESIPLLKPNLPQATYLGWIDASALAMQDDALHAFCLDRAGVALSAGNTFGAGGNGFLRINAACPRSTVDAALHRLKKAIDMLK